MRRSWPFWLPAFAIGIGVLIPIAYLLLRALEADPGTLADLVLRRRTARLVVNTVGLAAAVLIVDLIIAVPLAWLTTRTNLPLRSLFAALAMVPLAIPGYVIAYAFMGATGSYGTLTRWFGLTIAPVGGFSGALLALTLTTFPYLLLNVRAALLGIDASLEESARSLGYRPREVVFRVVLPQLRPALLAGGLLVVLHVFGDFGVVSLMRFETFSYAIYLQYTAAFDRTYAAVLALLLIAATTLLLFADARLIGRARYHSSTSGSRRRQIYGLGRWRPWSFVFLALVLVPAVLLPMVNIIYWSFGAPLAAWLGTVQAVLASASASIPAAVLGTAIATAIAGLTVRRSSRSSRIIERLAFFAYATPPLAFSLALVFFAIRFAPWWYQTLSLLIVAYALHFMAEAIGPVRTALLQVPPRLDDAARLLGRRPLGAFLTATLPLLKHGLSVAVILVFLSSMKELPITLLLAPLGFETLATNTWAYASEALFSQAAPFALVIVVFSSQLAFMLVRERTDDVLPALDSASTVKTRIAAAPRLADR